MSVASSSLSPASSISDTGKQRNEKRPLTQKTTIVVQCTRRPLLQTSRSPTRIDLRSCHGILSWLASFHATAAATSSALGTGPGAGLRAMRTEAP
eukprot:COSAG06_NODE_5193_length_3646_cov_8.121229_3_plen_95_part_00